MKYKIVQETSNWDLQKEVEYQIKYGWRPQGGVSVVFYSAGKEMWAQAMVKES